jgi:hypothetical protein
MALVVYIAFRISGENFMNGITSFHRFRQDLEIAGYLPSHFSENLSGAVPAASAEGAK